MGTPRTTTERQLELARVALSNQTAVLQKKGIAAADHRKDPKWRELNSKVRQIAARVRTIDAAAALSATVAKTKEERDAAFEAAKAEELAEALKPKSREPKAKPAAAAAPAAAKAPKKSPKTDGPPAAKGGDKGKGGGDKGKGGKK